MSVRKERERKRERERERERVRKEEETNENGYISIKMSPINYIVFEQLNFEPRILSQEQLKVLGNVSNFASLASQASQVSQASLALLAPLSVTPAYFDNVFHKQLALLLLLIYEFLHASFYNVRFIKNKCNLLWIKILLAICNLLDRISGQAYRALLVKVNFINALR